MGLGLYISSGGESLELIADAKTMVESLEIIIGSHRLLYPCLVDLIRYRKDFHIQSDGTKTLWTAAMVR